MPELSQKPPEAPEDGGTGQRPLPASGGVGVQVRHEPGAGPWISGGQRSEIHQLIGHLDVRQRPEAGHEVLAKLAIFIPFGDHHQVVFLVGVRILESDDVAPCDGVHIGSPC